ncbi:MAG: site-specific integrase [Eubacterium sp.]|nr:site-specific integrase [Eubacterium sp.]MCI9658582.1 site-specific integrase [Lachnospiraceae bacterium]
MARKKRTDHKGYVLRVGEYQDKSGRYSFKYTQNGKRYTVYGLTLKELREKEKQIEKDLEDGIDNSRRNITLNQLFREYLELKTDLKETTRCNYLASWNNAIRDSDIGKMKVSEIDQIRIRKFYAGLVKQGLAVNTIKFYHSLICPVLELAVDSNMIRKNPAKDARKGIGGTKREKTSITISQQEKLLDFLKSSSQYCVYHPLMIFALSTALRVGELTGLRWSDVDLKENIIHIRQQLIYRNLGDGCRFHVQNLKTEAGRRNIPLTASARKSLIKQKELSLVLGTKQRKEIDGVTDFVFLNSLGNPYAANAVNFMLKNVIDAYNRAEREVAVREDREPEPLPHISAHILRHTACTRLAESGIDPKTLQYIMGHSSIAVTMDIYNHVDTIRVKNEMEKAEDVIKYG